MDIYLVIVEDRHCDTTVYPFSDKEKAIAYAKKLAKAYCRVPAYYEEHDYGKDEGWLFYADYSCEGDNVHVVTAILDKEA